MSSRDGGRGRPMSGRGGGGGRGDFGGRGGGGRGGGVMSMQTALTELRGLFQGMAVSTAPRITADGLAARPSTSGSKGLPVKIFANHFKIASPNPNLVLAQYDVAITQVGTKIKVEPGTSPPMPPKNKCRAILGQLAAVNKWPAAWAYDGQKQLWTVGLSLPLEAKEFNVKVPDNTRRPAPGAAPFVVEYTVTIKGADTSAINAGKEVAAFLQSRVPVPRDTMQAMDVALRQGASQNPANRLIGRGIFTDEGKVRLGFGLEALRGYLQSFNATQCGLTVSIDPSVAAVPVAEELVNWMKEIIARNQTVAAMASRPLTPAQIRQLNDEVRRNELKIEMTHRATGQLKRKVRGFTDRPARECMFKWDKAEGQSVEISVEQYFKQAYNYTLKYPLLPCMVSGSSKKAPKDSKKPEWIPVEVCRIVPDIGKRGLTGEQTSEVLRMAAVPAMARKRETLQTLFEKAKLPSDPTAQRFGLTVPKTAELVAVEGRILPTPKLAYKDGAVSIGDRGSWDLQNVKLLKTAKLESFAVVCFAPEREVEGYEDKNGATGPVMIEFLDVLSDALQEKGITMALANYPPVVFARRGDQESAVLQRAMQRAEKELGKPAQILFVLQRTQNQVYNEVKRICDCELGVQSQCMVASKMGLGQDSSKLGSKLKGVALKVNIKLGGDNATIVGGPSTWCPTLARAGAGGQPARVMMLGADVTHPTNLPGQGKSDESEEKKKKPDQPSIAAVVGSVNLDCSVYLTRIRAQNPLVEEIADMEVMVFELLKQYIESNKTLPEVIIMWRDGLSESQFNTVAAKEFAAIRAACTRFKNKEGVPYNPKVTFTSVQKRHGTRLYPGERNADDCKTGNVKPGIVVDKEICSPTKFDFYLNSHAGIQGTNKPAKYSVLKDEVGFTMDAMEVLAYWLCHTFVRCSRTVSYVPPAYYAHHAAFRGRAWLRRLDRADTSSVSSGSSGAGWEWEFKTPHPAIRDTMYFI